MAQYLYINQNLCDERYSRALQEFDCSVSFVDFSLKYFLFQRPFCY